MRFLIVRVAALGDIVVSTALLNRIRATHPGARIVWLCGEGAAPLVGLLPGVDEVITVDERRLLAGSWRERIPALAGVWLKLLRHRFDRVLVLHADPRYRVLVAPAWPARVDRLSHPPGASGNPLLSRSRADEYARLLDGAVSRGPILDRFPLSNLRHRFRANGRHEPGSRHRVVLVPGGARNARRDDPLRRWPAASYVALAGELVARGLDVTLVGDGGDRETGRLFDGLAIDNRIGATSLLDMLKLLAEADVVVSHDTGPLHLARLVGTPVVGLFGPTDPRHVVGDDPDVTPLWGGAGLACRPCYDGRDYAACANNLCMQGISVDEVVRAVMDRIPARSPAAATAS